MGLEILYCRVQNIEYKCTVSSGGEGESNQITAAQDQALKELLDRRKVAGTIRKVSCQGETNSSKWTVVDMEYEPILDGLDGRDRYRVLRFLNAKKRRLLELFVYDGKLPDNLEQIVAHRNKKCLDGQYLFLCVQASATARIAGQRWLGTNRADGGMCEYAPRPVHTRGVEMRLGNPHVDTNV